LEFELQGEKVVVRTVQVSPGLKSVCMQHDLLEGEMWQVVDRFWREEKGQDIAEYAVMLAVILVIVVGTIRLIGSNANTVFSNVASSIQ
jgi:Flp pilus assembly pilin Flp